MDPNRQWSSHRTGTARETYPNPCEESGNHPLPPDITGARGGARGSEEPSRNAPAAPDGEVGGRKRVPALPGMDVPERPGGVRVRVNCWERRVPRRFQVGGGGSSSSAGCGDCLIDIGWTVRIWGGVLSSPTRGWIDSGALTALLLLGVF